jgi:uncharacterized Zn-finger protein
MPEKTQICEQEYRYVCEHPGCHKGYNSKMNLTIHERKHTGMRPFECEACHKTFPSNGNLKKHMFTHTAEIRKRDMKATLKNLLV